MDEREPGVDVCDEATARAVHEVELGLEWLQRARGALLEFHHATGHAMDHLDRAETDLRGLEQEDLADRLRDDLLPAGVTGTDDWSYAVVEQFDEGVLADVDAFEDRVREELTDGRRHVAERAQRRTWRARADRED